VQTFLGLPAPALKTPMQINGKKPSTRKRRMIVISLMGSTTLAYLAVTGLATNLALAGRGVVRTLRRAARGELAHAGKEALDALSTPAVLSQAASAGLVLEVFAVVQDVAGALAAKEDRKESVAESNGIVKEPSETRWSRSRLVTR
jgi:hypothetical protein